MVKWVNPTGDMTPARPDAAAGFGFDPPSTKSMAEMLYVLLVDSRVEWCRRCVRGWPQMTPRRARRWPELGCERGQCCGVRASELRR